MPIFFFLLSNLKRSHRSRFFLFFFSRSKPNRVMCVLKTVLSHFRRDNIPSVELATKEDFLFRGYLYIFFSSEETRKLVIITFIVDEISCQLVSITNLAKVFFRNFLEDD